MLKLVIFYFERKAATLCTLHKLKLKYHWHLGDFSWRLVGLVGKSPVWSYKEHPGNLEPWAKNLCCILGFSSEIIRTPDSSRLTFKGLGVCSYGIRDDLYRPQQVLSDVIWSIRLTPCLEQPVKKEVKIKSCATMVIRYVWYVFESRSFYTSSSLPISHSAYVCALIGIMHD